MNKVNDVDLLYEYFISHSNSDLDPTNTYSNNTLQNGCGVGSFLGGLFRTILPILRRSTVAFGTELIRNGLDEIDNEYLRCETSDRNQCEIPEKGPLELNVRDPTSKKRKLSVCECDQDKLKSAKKSAKKSALIQKTKKKCHNLECASSATKNAKDHLPKKSNQSSSESRRSKLSLKTEKDSKKDTRLKNIKKYISTRKHKKEKDIFSEI
jgi:hypothetical protein